MPVPVGTRKRLSYPPGKPPCTIQVKASRGQKMSQVQEKVGLYPPENLQRSEEEELKEEKKIRHQRRVKKLEQLERGIALNAEFLQALNEKDCIFEVQAAILGKLASEENYLKGLSEFCRVELSQEPFPERVKKAEEAIIMLKY